MKYKNVVKGIFIERPNRFVASVETEGAVRTVHVKNTGRCKELLVPGATVYLEKNDNPFRKTAYDIVAVEKRRQGKQPLLINMDSQAPNAAVEQWLKGGCFFSKEAVVRREVKYKSSRFDFYVEDGGKKIFLEVKGVTLEQDGIARFPDAPTLRGLRHINELAAAKEEGFDCYAFFLIQMKGIGAFMPNYDTHRDFGEALKIAKDKGVGLIAYDSLVTPDSITVDRPVKIIL